MTILTDDLNSVRPFLKDFKLPKPDSHKGQNGKLLIIGGSKLFHASSLWAAEIASHIVDMVHYASTKENNEIFLSLKNKFRNGMVISRDNLFEYIQEDDVILLGPGMVRTEEILKPTEDYQIKDLKELDEIEDEGIQTYYLTKYILHKFPNKKFVIDAGALQMMDPRWLIPLKEKAIITPHQQEFERIFQTPLKDTSEDKRKTIVRNMAKKYNCVIFLKVVSDIISDGDEAYVIKGGNAGLTKGGSGDVLAGLCSSFYTKNTPVYSAILASFFVKKTADFLLKMKGLWYNTDDLIEKIPQIMKEIVL